MANKDTDTKSPAPTETAELTEAIQELNSSVQGSNRANRYGPTFMRGIVGSLGAVVGATLIIALIIFVLQKLSGVPFVGQLFQLLLHTLQHK